MSLILYDFECQTCSHTIEHLCEIDVRSIDCPKCLNTMSRKISPVRSKLDGLDPGFPDAYDKWARQHEQAGKRQS